MQLSDKFEKLFSEYIDTDEHEELLETLFQLVRSTYIAGWEAGMREMEAAEPPPRSWGKGRAAALLRRENT